MKAMAETPFNDDRLALVRERLAQLPKTPGVYFMKDAEGRVLYVGKANDLRARVSSYFRESTDLVNTRGLDIAHMVTLVTDIDYLECENEVDALLKESRLIKDIWPPYNVGGKDDKTFPYLEITTGDDFPGVYVTRQPRLKGSKLYGPFLSAGPIHEALEVLQKIFRFRTCELDIRADDDKRRFFRPCLLHYIDRCSAPCADRVNQEAYAHDIGQLRKLLNSKRTVLLKQMRAEMAQAAAEKRYEQAALLRDRIRAVESLALSGNVDEHVQPEAFYVDPKGGLEKLQKLLELPAPPRIVEGIDIATLQGNESVGSLVCFIDGKEYKNGYRHYRIQTVEGVDDYAMIREIIARRYKYAAISEELFPDVILIDGGVGQLHAALEAFDRMKAAVELEGGRAAKPPMVISLAKREEIIYVQGRAEPHKLPRNHEGLRLLQRVRDEAHRFAQHYHHILRRKRVLEEDVKAGRRPPARSATQKRKHPPNPSSVQQGEFIIEEDASPPDAPQSGPQQTENGAPP